MVVFRVAPVILRLAQLLKRFDTATGERVTIADMVNIRMPPLQLALVCMGLGGK
jgi:hypothetical protein